MLAPVSTKSDRSEIDSQALMGVATTRTMERVTAALGALQEAPIRFESVSDVPQGGVLLALPALLAIGLLKHTKDFFSLPPGFYGIETIFLVLALMALARIKSPEGLRYTAPGEWGKMIGLDRIPEVKTLREKLSLLCNEAGRSERWGTRLASDWMEADPESAGVFYADGHVRLYHGDLTQLPRRYVTRERLCLRGTTDYWVNALGGRPFFVVTKEVDPGLLAVLREKIVPWLKAHVPNQPTESELQNDPHRYRFTIVFDREGYSPEFFSEMKKERIAVLTYRKNPGEDWSAHEFQDQEVRLVTGEVTTMKLAERGVDLGKLWVREIRKLTGSGHQTSMVSTDFHLDRTKLAPSMFARWCQENFFKYMREHFNLDRLVEYGTEPIPATTRLVNPAWRELDGKVRNRNGKLQREMAFFGELSLNTLEKTEVETYQKKKGEMQENISCLQQELEKLKKERKETAHHITVDQLPEKDRFTRLATEKKHFVDTIKMIAYRAETTMAHVLKEKLSRADDVRVLLRRIYENEVDLKPDLEAKTLTVQLHHLATHAHDEAIRHLCEELTATETIFPGTNLRLIYKLGSSQNPAGQEV